MEIKMKTGIKLLAAVGCLSLWLSAGPAVAQGYGGHEKGDEIGAFRMLLRSANLTADQKEQVHRIVQAAHGQSQPLLQQIHQIHEQIADKLVGTAAVKASDIAPLEQEASKLRDQIASQMVQTALQIRAILTPAQLQTISQLHQKLASLHSQMDDLVNPEGQGPPEHE